MTTITRKRKGGGYTVLPNEIFEDPRLDFAAIGLLAYLQSRPDNWKIQITNLRDVGLVGRDKVYSLLKVLKEAGYIETEQSRNANNQFGKVSYVVNDIMKMQKTPLTENPEAASLEPFPENPETVKNMDFTDAPLPEKPYTEKPEALISKDYNNTPLSPKEPPNTPKPKRLSLPEAGTATEDHPYSVRKFDQLWHNWPADQHPDSRHAAFAVFQKLTDEEQQQAVDEVKKYIKRCKSLRKFPLLFPYLDKRLFAEFVDGPPVNDNGYFVIERGTPEFSEWSNWFLETHGAESARKMQEMQSIERSTRWPPKQQVAS